MSFCSFKAILFSYAFFYYILITISLLSAIFGLAPYFRVSKQDLVFVHKIKLVAYELSALESYAINLMMINSRSTNGPWN